MYSLHEGSAVLLLLLPLLAGLQVNGTWERTELHRTLYLFLTVAMLFLGVSRAAELRTHYKSARVVVQKREHFYM